MWKQPKYLLVDEWMNNVLYTCNGVLFNHKKERNSDTAYAMWMNLKDIMLSERSQSQNDKYGMIPLK